MGWHETVEDEEFFERVIGAAADKIARAIYDCHNNQILAEIKDKMDTVGPLDTHEELESIRAQISTLDDTLGKLNHTLERK